MLFFNDHCASTIAFGAMIRSPSLPRTTRALPAKMSIETNAVRATEVHYQVRFPSTRRSAYYLRHWRRRLRSEPLRYYSRFGCIPTPRRPALLASNGDSTMLASKKPLEISLHFSMLVLSRLDARMTTLAYRKRLMKWLELYAF